MSVPEPEFTIAELLRDAVEKLPAEEERVFTAQELAVIWGYRSKRTAYIKMDALTEQGWKFVPTRKAILDRVGRYTSTDAYLVVPPGDNVGAVEEDIRENSDKKEST